MASEKQPVRSSTAATNNPTCAFRGPPRMFTAVLASLFILGYLHLFWPDLNHPLNSIFEPTNNSAVILSKDWKWTDIKPSRDLIWHTCFQDFQCARLDVPLDWLDPSDEKRVVIAVIKLPAKNVKDYKGPVFTNPGGPGGSGVYALKDRGKALQKIVGVNHDIISFDPRGIGATTPQVDCWKSKQQERIWNLQEVGVIDAHPGVLYDVYARSVALSGVCTSAADGQRRNGTGEEILSFVSTTSVARDMLEILNRGGYGNLRYWGFSYGTMLGGMFAALYPDRVERLVSDGNVDYLEWTNCSHLSFLHDTDKVMDAFYYFCHKSGPSSCDFYSPDPTTIKTRLQTLLQTLRIRPVIVPAADKSTDLPDIITYTSLQRFITTALYQPILVFPPLATILAALEKGDGRPFLDVLTARGMREQFECDCDSCGIPPDVTLELESYDDATRAIVCSDGGGINDTVEEFEVYADGLMRMSKAAGAVNVLFRVSCVGWTPRAKWYFKGPFTGNTSHPILYIANKADNVTPLRSARQNAKGFKDSVILIQNSYGHTTLSAPSMCTARYIRAYFQNGTLPEPDTECEADMEPFQVVHNGANGINGIFEEVEVKDLADALWDLTMKFRKVGFQ